MEPYDALNCKKKNKLVEQTAENVHIMCVTDDHNVIGS